MVGVFAPWKLVNTTKYGFWGWSESVYQHTTALGFRRGCSFLRSVANLMCSFSPDSQPLESFHLVRLCWPEMVSSLAPLPLSSSN